MSTRRSWIRWGGVGAALCALSLLSCKEAVMEPLTVAAVEVAGGGVNLRLGQTAQLTPTLKSANGYVLPKVGISWSSSDGAKASISPSGQVTAVSRGPVTLTATAGGVNGTAAVTVIGVQSITLAPETLSVIVTQTRAMTATTVLDPGVTVTPTWRSLDTTIARVGTDGRVTATSTTGIARIEVTAEEKKDTAVVRVVPVPVVSVVVSPDTATRSVGQTLQLTATPKDSIGGTLMGRAVTWSSSDTARAAVSTAGLVTVKAAGTATITAAAEGKTGSATLTLKVPVADVTVSQTSCTGSGSFSGGTGRLYTSETCEYGALVRDAAGNSLTDRTLTWTSSDTTVAKIDGAPFAHPTTKVSTVKLLPRKGGTITLTAAVEGKSSSATLTVLVPVASVTVTPATATLEIGATRQLTASLKDSSGGTLTGRTVSWATSDSTKASVSSTGLVTGVASGSAMITATSEGKSASIGITTTATVLDIDGNSYSVLTIGSQRWLDKNLRVSRYLDGSTIANTLDATSWVNSSEGQANSYRNNVEYDASSGKLYNWIAVTDSRGICPVGWKVPSDADWNMLITFLGGPDSAAVKLKSLSDWPVAKGGTNSVGFNASPSGWRSKTGAFSSGASDEITLAYVSFWSTSKYLSTPGSYWVRTISPLSFSYINRDHSDIPLGISVRCIGQ